MSSTLTGQAQSEILAHIQSRGGPFSSWYCGIAASPRDRLFVDHNVDEQNGKWVFRDCGSEAGARAVEKYLLSLGCEGGGGGGGPDTRFVYAYRITSTTRE